MYLMFKLNITIQLFIKNFELLKCRIIMENNATDTLVQKVPDLQTSELPIL